MSDTRVETISRLVRWKLDSSDFWSAKKSNLFKIGIWNWYLLVEKNGFLSIQLFPETSSLLKDQSPLATFVIGVSNAGGVNRRTSVSRVNERIIRSPKDFVWHVDQTFQGRFTIEVEFMDLKICDINGKELMSERPMRQSISTQHTLRCLARMLEEGIHADVTIHTAEGTLKAHKAILSATSPVFESMFHHDLKEKESSTIHIDDMCHETCTAFLCYLYGTIPQTDFWKHRLTLLSAADKYCITDLKDACEESLMEDINSENVLSRIQEAWLYQLHKLKKECFTYLFDFGKIHDVKNEINNFFMKADRELMVEIVQKLLTVWKPL